MDMSKFEAVLKHMTLDELREANRLVCNRINTEHTLRQQTVMRNFRIGQRIKFVARGGRIVYGIVERMNTKSLSGRVEGSSGTWRAAPSLCQAA